ncbi:hypothetical protein [Rhizobium sp. BK376]|uniref:hypothetical protein n=1 Tax=Rhizobium sp. BK376 TaxID=2512149 RepID=UPI0010DE4AB9|nr:hypothetical protein [Rhizobium sp. BK376]TCR91317.1 hypothetical protein EV561_103715 [Rhizobium sp. BK376]
MNDAYIATGKALEYVDNLSQLRPDGTLKSYAETRVGPSGAYEKLVIATQWRQIDWPFISTFDRYGPVFTSCRLLGHEPVNGYDTDHYSATWHSFPFSPSYDMWVSVANGRVIKVVRDYSTTTWEFSFPIAVDLFDYSHKADAEPKGSTQ